MICNPRKIEKKCRDINVKFINENRLMPDFVFYISF